MPDTDFQIKLTNFNEGLAPVAHLDNKTFIGSAGQASDMKADVISNPGFLQQAPGLSNLTNGTQAGAVDQLIRFILDKPVNSTDTYALGTTKFFKLSATEVISYDSSASSSPSSSPSASVSNSASPSSSPSASPGYSEGGVSNWPHTITNMTSGESLIRLGNNVFGFYNKASGGDIFTYDFTTGVIYYDWGSITDQALENAPHPSAVKEDIILFGNGQYVGAYIQGTGILNTQKLDFKAGAEVVDVVFHANAWWIAVNYGQGKRGQIYMYEAGAQSNQLLDEAGIGDQQIGFLYVHNGNIFVAYDDKSSDGYAIGVLQGRVIKPLRYFSGSLPNHRQKALYKNTILFCSSGDLMSFGASIETAMPLQISKLMDGGYGTLGGLAAPFGTPMIASTDGDTNHRIAKFSGYSTDSNWKSVFIPITKGKMLGRIEEIVVSTKTLATNARADITLEGNQGGKTTTIAMSVTGANVTRKVFTNIDMLPVEDVRVVISYTNGNTSATCPIRAIELIGNFVEV